MDSRRDLCNEADIKRSRERTIKALLGNSFDMTVRNTASGMVA